MAAPGRFATEIATWLTLAAFSGWGAAQVGWAVVDHWVAPAATEPARESMARRSEPRTEPQTERERFAAQPDLEAALRELHWQGGDEVDAARFLSVVRALDLGWHRQGGDYEARHESERIVSELWQAHPELVTATTCTYCGRLSDAVRHQVVEAPPDPAWIAQLAGSHPRYLHELASNGMVSPERTLRLAAIHAELSSPGDAPTAGFVGSVLIQAKAHDALLAWVSKGLNGGRALDDVSDLSALPSEIVIAAWRRGVSIGSESPRLTEYLLLQGYRPALRWLVWLLDGGAEYVSTGDYQFQRYQKFYVDTFRLNVTFRSYQGRTLGQFYSHNWRDIHWNADRRIWQLTELAGNSASGG